MPRFLLTNDDGVDAPVLPMLHDALARHGDVAVVVPDGNRSWIAKAITREREVRVRSARRDEVDVLTVTGTPADCVQLAVSGLVAPVDVVVSGINLGRNHGEAFVGSSGTVGAALEGGLQDLPSFAVSTGERPGEDYGRWRGWSEHHVEARPGWRRLAELSADLVVELLGTGLADHAQAVSIQLPWDAEPSTPRRLDRVAPVRYGALFRQVDETTWRHDRAPLSVRGDLDGTDQQSVDDDVISITPLSPPRAADVPDDVRAAVVRP